ncbi:MAG: VOC family protein [Oscillospiraceae bacterium]|nr:VOC family protein [Oscillospiraceae bacterium]MDD4367542.1 VOC family protein [Oscillospiraceae bacterium]
MTTDSPIKLNSFTLDCLQAQKLAAFYARLLQWEVVYTDNDYAVAAPPRTALGAYPGLTFQSNPDYLAPVWPETADCQQQMAHLDFAVADMTLAVQTALDCGARLAPVQFSDQWTVMFDPSGHPFCLCLLPQLFNSADFALR